MGTPVARVAKTTSAAQPAQAWTGMAIRMAAAAMAIKAVISVMCEAAVARVFMKASIFAIHQHMRQIYAPWVS